MSTYYSAYLGKKTKDGIYEIVGPYVVNKDGKSELSSLWWRSQSFIHWNEWEVVNIPENKLGEKAYENCTSEGIWEDSKRYSIGYWIPAKEIYRKGSCEPVRGYVPIQEAAELIASGYDQDYISWSMSRPIPSDFLVGLSEEKRNEYSFVSYIDYSSTQYHMWELGRILNGYDEFELLGDGEELGIIFRVG